MNSNLFDTLAKGLATNRLSRRQVLKSFVASIVVGAMPFLDNERAEAATCKANGRSCTGSAQCCSKYCSGGVCRCKPNGKSCTGNAQCCSSICLNGQCRCKANGKSCTSNKQCCSGNCDNGVCRPPVLCGSDAPTAASLGAARTALASGATEVELSPGGCWRYRRTLSGTSVSSEVISADGIPVSKWSHTSVESIGQDDANRDGFFETRTRIVRGPTANEQRAEITSYAKATQAPIRRETYTRTDATIHAIWERDDGSGSLETISEFDTTLTQGLGPETLPATNRSAPEITPQAACSQENELTIRQRLLEAVVGGLDCMSDKGRPDIGAKILRHYLTRNVIIGCEALPNNSYAEISWWRTFVEWTDIVIDVDWSLFGGLTPDQQRNVLWHEILHLQFGAHNPFVLKAPRVTEIDQTYACASLCFTFNPDQMTKCSCARCLGTNYCDTRCSSYAECNPDMGGFCPCSCNLRWYNTQASCAAECPSGLCCFASRCILTYDVFC